MKKLGYLILGGILSLVLLGSAVAKVNDVPLDQLKQTTKQKRVALIVTRVVDKYHYRDTRLDDDLSAQILDKYLESLDFNKSFFTQQDMAEFERYRTKLDDDLSEGKVDAAFTIFRRFRSRVDTQVEAALQLLTSYRFDFERDEYYQFDREDADWATDDAALHDLWRRRVKNDILSLRMDGKDEEEIKETLTKRYEGISRRIHQFTADDVFQTFINAYTQNVEPHTSYMSPRSSENFDITMRLSLQGIGAVLRQDNEQTLVQRVVPGGPADKSGQLHAGDSITGVAQGEDGEMVDVVGWRLQDVVDLIRGEKESVVRLNISPKSSAGGGKAKVVAMVREEIKLEDQAAKSSIIEGLPGMDDLRIGVIDVPTFYRDFSAQMAGEKDFRSTTRDVRNLLLQLEKDAVAGVVIDLRQNGGGSLTEATELTGLFIEQGPVVQIKDSSGRVEVEQDPDPEQVYSGPLVVLVDRNSASASEIFAGAIQDYGRGLVIGEPTFGKGTVQTLVDLERFSKGEEDLGRLRLTMAQFFRVEGASTQHKGVVPDVVFPTATGASDHGERSLDNALPWASIEPVKHQKMNAMINDYLQHRHQQRISKDPGFAYLLETEQAINEIRNEDQVSLLETARKAQWEQREQAQLDRRNRLRRFRGLEQLTKLDDEDDELIDPDAEDPEGIKQIMLDEAAYILADYIQQNRPVTAQVD